MSTRHPIVGITCDLFEGRARVRMTYSACVARAGGVPLLLPPVPELAGAHAQMCDALILTGGDDPIMEDFGVPTHPAATKVEPARQAHELALLKAFDARAAAPVLGVCLGMQYMALTAGGTLDQHMPESTATAGDHAGERVHAIEPEGGELPRGRVTSHHHQAVRDAGRLRVVARAHDGVIEAIDDPSRAFWLGVQWHPERTAEPGLGQAIFDRLIEAARG